MTDRPSDEASIPGQMTVAECIEEVARAKGDAPARNAEGKPRPLTAAEVVARKIKETG